MVSELGSILLSPIFTFVVGADKTAIEVHSKALSRLSPALAAMMNNGMKASVNKSAMLPDITEECFMRFCEFAYTGSYSVSEVRPQSDSSGENNSFSVAWRNSRNRAFRQSTGLPGESLTNKSSVVTSLDAHVYFASVWSSEINARFGWMNRDKPKDEQPHLEYCDYTTVFREHIELYILADQFQIISLLKVVHEEIVKALLYSYHGGASLENFLALVRFVYEGENGLIEGLKEIRTMIALFLGANSDYLLHTEEFEELLLEGGQFVLDFFRHLATGMSNKKPEMLKKATQG